ncbi:MAG TPA: sugar nucleotide-binding protein, partial [Verrucomicrobiae bacterium]|nr:sugar nucleotide-binding protein [Verrucomicrobiae bacterium]
KWAAEQAVRQSVLNWTIFRPSIIYGRDDAFVNLFVKIAARSPVVPLIGGGRSKFQPIPVHDVARCFVRSLSEPKSIKQTLDLGGDQVLTLAEIVNAVLAATGRHRLKLPVPFGLARMQAALLEYIYPKLLGKASPLNRDQLLMLQEVNVGNPGAATQLFDLKPEPFAFGIARYLKSNS